MDKAGKGEDVVDFLRGTSVVGVVVVEPEGLMGLAH